MQTLYIALYIIDNDIAQKQDICLWYKEWYFVDLRLRFNNAQIETQATTILYTV